MLQGLAQFRITLLQFLKQPDVFNGNHCLIGKGFNKRDLFFRERPNFRSAKMDDAERNSFAHQRHRQNCFARARLLVSTTPGIPTLSTGPHPRGG